MECPNCGWHVRGGARFCPNCGAEMPAEGPRTCPRCQAEVKGQVSLCPSCGAVLDGEGAEAAAEKRDAASATPRPEPAPPDEAPAEEKEGVRTCPSCKSQLTGKVGICPVCGEDLSGPRPAPRRTRAADDWPFGPSAGPERPLASKMKPLSPNWPFDEEPAPKPKSGKKKKAAASKAKQPDQAKPAEPDAEGKPDAGKQAAPPKPPAAEKAPAGEEAAGRGPAEADRPPEVKPWYVARPTQDAGTVPTARPTPAAKPTPPSRPTPAAKPTFPSRPAPAARPTPATRRMPAAKPALGRVKRSLIPSKGLGLLPWFGMLAGLVLVSVLVYGVAAGALPLPHLGGGQPAATATPTMQPTQAPTQTPQPTPTGTPLPPTPTPEPVVHVVGAGESLLSIAADYGIAVEDLIAANGITEGDVLMVGQELLIPGGAAPTEVPTAAPTEVLTAAPTEAPTEAATEAATATGETATAQPTPLATATVALEFPAPNLLNPADGATFGAEDVLLNWSSVGLLADDTWYVVKIWTDDPNLPTLGPGWTRTTSWRIPVSSRPPADAASHTFHWTVTVMRAVEGQEVVAVSPVSETRSFEWQ